MVFLSIGSNIGNRADNLSRAAQMLADKGLIVERVSSLYETKPWGYTGQPDFLNLALEAYTHLPPLELLGVLKAIEIQMGRTDAVRWGPRVIDIDILLYGDSVFDTEGLTIPHPLMHRRGFVLRPLAEIAPDLIHPVLKKDVRTLLEELHEECN